MKIMVVDDEPVLRKSICILLKRMNPNVQTEEAADGLDALEKMSCERYHALFTDIHMPRMDGLDLIQTVNAKYANVQIIILTGFAYFDYARKALQYGALDYLLKPVRYNDLQAALQKVQARLEMLDAQEVQAQTLKCDEQSMKDTMAQACAYIEKNYAQNLSLAHMSERFFLNASYFCEQFTKSCGKTFIEYLTAVRMRQACMLMIAKEEKAIADIASDVGYADARYFSQVFKKAYGASPSDYRRKLAQDGAAGDAKDIEHGCQRNL